VLFTDTFDTGALYLWQPLQTGWSLIASEGGQALQATNTEEPVTFVHNTLGDSVAQARFAFASSMARLSLRQSEAGAYTVLLNANGQVALYRGSQILGAATVSANSPDQWRFIRLSAIGGIVRVAIDGVEVIAVEDTNPLPIGTLSFAGVGIGSSTLLVDDVTVWIPAGAEPTSTPTETETATQTPSATATSTPKPLPEFNLIYSQNFDGTSDPYNQLSDTWPIVPSEQDYALYLSGAKYLTRVTRNRLKTAQIEARFYLTEGTAELGLRRGATQGYIGALSVDGQVHLYRDTAPVQAVSLNRPVINQWHALRLFVVDSTVQVFVDGDLLLTYIDPQPLPRGTAYFAADQLNTGYVLIDDIRLWTPELQAASSTQDSTPSRNQAISPRAQAQGQLTPNELPNQTAYEFGPDEQLISVAGTVTSVLIRNTASGWTTLRDQTLSEGNDFISLSQDGRWVAFNCGGYPNGICIVTVDGTDFSQVNISNLNLVRNPAWSPDGTQLAFEASGDTPSETGIWLVNLDDSSLTQLTTGGSNPRWVQSIDGSFLFYNGAHGNIYQIRMDLAQHPLTVAVSVPGGALYDVQTDESGYIWIAYDTLDSYESIAAKNVSVPEAPTSIFTDPDNVQAVDYESPCVFEPPFEILLSPDAKKVAYVTLWRADRNGTCENFNFRSTELAIADFATGNNAHFFPLVSYPVLPRADWGYQPKLAAISPGALPVNSLMVYTSKPTDAGSDTEIYLKSGFFALPVRKTDTSAAPNHPGTADHPALSPDGQSLAFSSIVPEDGRRKIFVRPVVDAFTNNTNQISLDWGDYPTWSPDNQRLAFIDTDGNLAVINRDGTGKVTYDELGISLENISGVKWSPVANRLALGANGRLYLIDLDGESPGVMQLTQGPLDLNPSWSPDGSQIVFSSNRENARFNLFIVNSDGSGTPVNITNSETSDDVAPTWSTDGLSIGYTSTEYDGNGAAQKKFVILQQHDETTARLSQARTMSVTSNLTQAWDRAYEWNVSIASPAFQLEGTVPPPTPTPTPTLTPTPDLSSVTIEASVNGKWVETERKNHFKVISLPDGKIIPFDDDVQVTIKITNSTNVKIESWQLELSTVQLSGTYDATNPNPLIEVDGGGAVASNGVMKWKQWGTHPLDPGATYVANPVFRSARSGTITASYRFIACFQSPCSEAKKDIYATISGTLNIMDVSMTRIKFDDLDRASMFWAIFNETSEDTYASGSKEQIWLKTEQVSDGTYINKTIYNTDGYSGGSPANLLSQNLEPDNEFRPYAIAEFLTLPPLCDFSSGKPGNNASPAEDITAGWSSHNKYLIHCNTKVDTAPNPINGDHTYLMAQTVINGFINYERSGSSTFLYLMQNFKGSLGNCPAPEYIEDTLLKSKPELIPIFKDALANAGDSYCKQVALWFSANSITYSNSLWSDVDGCSAWDRYASEWLSWRQNNGYLTYQQMAYAALTSGTYNIIREWVYRYLQCQLHHNFTGRRALMYQAYDNIMREITTAVDHIAVPSLAEDPVYGAFSVLDANIAGKPIVTPPDGVIPYDAPQDEIIAQYNQHIVALKANVGSHDRVLRPVIRIERLGIKNDDGEVIGYQYVGLRWITKSLNQGDNSLHIPR
jgi:Tol biopolymer transport system component